MNIKDLKNMDKEQILAHLGLEEDSALSSILGALGWICVGALGGAVAALLLAPKTGRELRETVGRKIKHHADDLISTARSGIDELAAEKGGL